MNVKTGVKKNGANFFEIKIISENSNVLKLYEEIGFKDFEHKMRMEL